MSRTREEHLKWCKERAHEYVWRGELVDAVTSMMSDLSKHPDTASSATGILAQLGLYTAMQAQQGDRAAVVRFIDGFN